SNWPSHPNLRRKARPEIGALEDESRFMANILPRKLQRLLRAFNLLWGRMGSARIYAAVIIGLVLVLAAIGASHIIDVWNQFGLPKFHQATATTISPEPV